MSCCGSVSQLRGGGTSLELVAPTELRDQLRASHRDLRVSVKRNKLLGLNNNMSSTRATREAAVKVSTVSSMGPYLNLHLYPLRAGEHQRPLR